MDIFEEKAAHPMLVGSTCSPFDDDEYIYELKLDGERCLAYLDTDSTVLINGRGTKMLPKLPELAGLQKQVEGRCILDGELVVLQDGKPSFEGIMHRTLLRDRTQREFAARNSPASLVVFDILYLDGEQTTQLPLTWRKDLLQSVVKQEDARLSISRTVEGQGTALFEQARLHGLEGIMAKRAGSTYRMGRRSTDWAKIKNVQDDEYVICGYIQEAQHVASLILGQYTAEGALVYKGHVTLALRSEDYTLVLSQPTRKTPPFAEAPPPGHAGAVWLQPRLVCTVQFTNRTAKGGNRHPVYKGLRPDKAPNEAMENPT